MKQETDPFVLEARNLMAAGDLDGLRRGLPEIARKAAEAGALESAALLWIEWAVHAQEPASAEVLEALARAGDLAETAQAAEVAVRAHLERAVRLEALGRIREALDWAKRADAWAEVAGDRVLWAVVLLTLSRLFRWAGETESARQAAEMAVSFGHEVQNRSVQGMGLAALAEARLAEGDVEGAAEAARGAEVLGQDLKDPALWAQAASIRSACALAMGRPREAQGFLEEARQAFQEAEAGSEDGLALLQAQAAWALGDLEGAEAALARACGGTDSTLVAMAGVERVVALCAMGQFEEARHLVEEGLERVRQAAIPRLKVLGLMRAAQALWALQRPEQAIEVAGEAMRLARVEAPDLAASARVLCEEMTTAHVTRPGLA